MDSRTVKNLDRLEDELGKDGVLRLMEERRKRAHKVEAEMVAAWYKATGELPPEGGEVEKLILGYVHREERESSRLERIIRDARHLEVVTGTSGLKAMRNQRKSRTAGAQGGRSCKRAAWADAARELISGWDDLPGPRDPLCMQNVRTPNGEEYDYEVYRDGGKVIAVDAHTRREIELSLSTLKKRYPPQKK